MTFRAAIESNLSAIGRPARAAKIGAVEGGQLHEIESIAVAYPNLRVARAPGKEGDALAIRRIFGIHILPRRGDQPDRRIALAFCAWRLDPPNVKVNDSLRVGEAVSLT